jgi:DNA-binding MarR family transcriptional regulator
VTASLSDRTGHAELSESFGLTLSEWRLLANVAADPAMTFSKLAQRLHQDKGQLSRSLMRLAGQGLLKTDRTPSDLRGIEIKLTRDGAKLYRKIFEVVKMRNSALRDLYNATEWKQFNAFLQRLQVFVEEQFQVQKLGDVRPARAKTASRTKQGKSR